MARPRDLPGYHDAVIARRVARSFLVVRLVRGTLLLVFLAVAVVGVEVRGWPRSLSVAIVLAMLLIASTMIASHRRFLLDDARSAPPPGRDSSQT